MAERRDRQGWRVPQRVPAIAAAATVALIGLLLTIAGWTYARTVAPTRHPPIQTFPAPGIETYVHDGVEDPVRPRPAPRPDPAIAAAKRAVVAEGIAGWPR